MPTRNLFDRDVAAVTILEFLLHGSRRTQIEMRAIVCRDGNTFFWHGILPGTANNAPGVDLDPDECPGTALTVGYVHTHWNQFDQNMFPSGWSNIARYHDANGITPEDEPSDLKIADIVFADASAPQPKAQDLMWYVGSAPTFGGFSYVRYKRMSESSLAKDNVYLYNRINREWVREPPLW